MRKPFFRAQNNCWYVVGNNGKFIKLDPDEETAHKMWSKMLELGRYQESDSSIEALLEAWLRDIELKVPADQHKRYVGFCEQFCNFIEPDTKSRDVTGSDVLRWVRATKLIHKEKRQWSLARQRDAGQAIKRAFDWAIKRHYVPWCDVLDLEFESPDPRDSLISYAVHQQLMNATREPDRSRPFGLMLIALRHTGARPIQIREVTAANVNADCSAWIFDKHKTKKTKKTRLTVRLTPCLRTLTRILKHYRPHGNLFLNWQQMPWSKNAIIHRLARMREKLKITNCTAYSYRHSFATDHLLSGVDPMTVAVLLGHKDASMVMKVYGHLIKCPEHLEDALLKTAKHRGQSS